MSGLLSYFAMIFDCASACTKWPCVKNIPVFVEARVPAPIAGFATVLVVCIVKSVTEFVMFSPGLKRTGVVAPAVADEVDVYSI